MHKSEDEELLLPTTAGGSKEKRSESAVETVLSFSVYSVEKEKIYELISYIRDTIDIIVQ